ncbi:tRNA (adenosine(37)-N6)-threonylcarbamoyltransferase complex transferase subunit TsaD [Carboxydochorda subterranea]|uniref:tRNA N6-adenosine threonylcarbamoyltransferase n=1 Tax=Carboxydichorda subterranea TaxID=3109565 RepID=A0ABZ1BYW1_9FIRM|nr:tRNA (adenosine(37)-N6)-threonylcarbamoyltransferase complex transferase subunit TsaD [Limnochorda sp. L945t]WRP18025.1 tRNA (adenosine(37)-N6)-threonylcarbamoyltransferase complex transferase subunit TsaD [Limnochorda sp. L945t]
MKPYRGGLLLGIDTSCDDTAAAVVKDGREILSSAVASQVEVHRPFGGVVPEIASRRHLVAILPVIRRALDEAGIAPQDLDGVAATYGPGLVGSLLVGFMAGKALALAIDRPFVGVDHLEGHASSIWLARPALDQPAVVLVASGGHTELLYVRRPGRFESLGGTRDDAAGEAFDKVGRLLGLGYPAGPAVDRLSERGRPDAVRLPRGLSEVDTLDLSFSGLKTAASRYMLPAVRDGRLSLEDAAASLQEAIVDVLVDRLMRAAERTGARVVAATGGVAANRGLRRALSRAAQERALDLILPEPALCTDNGAMIAAAGHFRLLDEGPSDTALAVDPSARIPQANIGADTPVGKG